MIKFIELTDPNTGSKSIINTIYIVSVHKAEDGSTVSVIFGGLTKKYTCAESYDYILKELS